MLFKNFMMNFMLSVFQVINMFFAILAHEQQHVCALSTFLCVMIESHGPAVALREFRVALEDETRHLLLIPVHEPGHWTLLVRVIVYQSTNSMTAIYS